MKDAELIRLIESTEKKCNFLSDLNRVYESNDYKKVMSYGKQIVPIIIKRLDNTHIWYHALNILTKNKMEHIKSNDFIKLNKEWNKWYKENGL